MCPIINVVHSSKPVTEMAHRIVVFPTTKECEAVPSMWVTQRGKKVCCFWPPYKGLTRVKEALLEQHTPHSSQWILFEARDLGTAGRLYNNYVLTANLYRILTSCSCPSHCSRKRIETVNYNAVCVTCNCFTAKVSHICQHML